MTRQTPARNPAHLRIDGSGLRQRLAAVAAAIASSEDEIAETLERMAVVLPENAVRLRARAAQARLCATVERRRAAEILNPS